MQWQYFEMFKLLYELNNALGSKLFDYAFLNVLVLMKLILILLYSAKGVRVHLLSTQCLNCVICRILGNRCAIVLSILTVLSITTLLVTASTVKMYLILELYKTEVYLICGKE